MCTDMLHIILRKYLRSNANQWFAWSFLESKMDGNSKLNVLLYSVLFTVHFSIVTVYKNHRENVPGNIMYDLRSFRKTSNLDRATSRSLRLLDRPLLLTKYIGDETSVMMTYMNIGYFLTECIILNQKFISF